MTEVIARPKVFLSYSNADRAWAEEFAQRLKERSIEVWAADEQFANGGRVSESLVRELKESDVVVILFDSETLQNPNSLAAGRYPHKRAPADTRKGRSSRHTDCRLGSGYVTLCSL